MRRSGIYLISCAAYISIAAALLTYITPACSICKCLQLPHRETHVNCTGLSLKSLDGIVFPSTMTVLTLKHNTLQRITHVQFATFVHLKVLDISSNKISEVGENSFGNLTKLKRLFLSDNRISDRSFYKGVLCDLTNLEVLALNGNIMERYPEAELSCLSQLHTLYLDGVFNSVFGTNFRNLTHLETLSLSGENGFCNISSLVYKSFENVPHLFHLDISLCAITNIEAGTFSTLRSLMYLDMSDNRLGLNTFVNSSIGLQLTNITTLKINNIVKKYVSCVVLEKNHVSYLSNTSLKFLHVDNNYIQSINLGVLPLLPKTLTFISAQKNNFNYGLYMSELKTLTGLQTVRLSGKTYPMNVPLHYHYPLYNEEQEFECIDESSAQKTAAILAAGYSQSLQNWPPHQYGDTYDEQYGNRSFNLTLPPYLRSIQMNFTQLTFLIGHLKFDAPSLTYLDLSSNLVQFQYGQLQGLENVTYLDLSNNLARNMSEHLLNTCTSLETLNISFNFFGWRLNKKQNNSYFKNLFRLKELVISNNMLSGLSGGVFRDLHALQVLNITANGMFYFQPDIQHMVNLTYIDCSYNQIKWLSQKTMDEIDILKRGSSRLILNLGVNPISCGCQNLKTLTWLLHSGVTPHSVDGYYCLMANTTPRFISSMDDFTYLVQQLTTECHSYFGLAMGCFASLLAITVLIGVALVYRYRWKLRYLYYAARFRNNTDSSREGDDFCFNAFVSYADEDRSFVINELSSILEGTNKLKLNIHHRDFTPGEAIASNIIQAIKKSRKIIIVLSPKFIDSYWCLYELRMAQLESVATGRDIIVVVMLHSIVGKRIPSDIYHCLQLDTYIEYPRMPSNRVEFWSRLIAAISPTSHV